MNFLLLFKMLSNLITHLRDLLHIVCHFRGKQNECAESIESKEKEISWAMEKSGTNEF